MRRRRRTRSHDSVEIAMGPMIDMVFLLLVFFMVTAKPIREEGDISIGLPGTLLQEEPVEIPDEQRVVIQEGGQVVLNEVPLDHPSSRELSELVAVLSRFKQSAEGNRVRALVTLVPDDAVPHQRLVDVLNACAEAGIDGVTFDTSREGGG